MKPTKVVIHGAFPRQRRPLLESLEKRVFLSAIALPAVQTPAASDVSIAASSSDGSITGLVFDDTKGTGQFAKGDPRLPGVTVFVDTNRNGIPDSGELSTTTNTHGKFTFSDLATGTYYVAEQLNPGVIQTSVVTSRASLTDLGTATFVAAPQNAPSAAVGVPAANTLTPTEIADAYETNVTFNGSSQTAADGLGPIRFS